MTLVELRYIVAVAREKHFGRAAKACFVSQPTLSVAVKKLEAELDVTIFERGGSQVVVTTIGQKIISRAQQTLEAAAGIRHIAANKASDMAEPLRVGVIFTIGPYLLPNLIPALRSQTPDLRVIVEEGFTADLRMRLKQGSLDVIILARPFTEPGVEIRSLYQEPFIVVLPSAHPWSARKSIHPDELSEETVLLLGKGHCFRDQVLEVCPGCLRTGEADDLQKTLEGGSIETIRHMVASGVGVTVLPCSAAGAEEYSRRLLSVKRFSGETPSREVIISWRKGFVRTPAVQAVVSAVKSCNMTCVKMLD
jgi:LysR family hydrogen peroxide-inducible transcriptional activator